MSIFAIDTPEQITDEYIRKNCVVSRYMSTGEAYSLVGPDGKRYTDYSDMFWKVFNRSITVVKEGIHELHNRSASHLKIRNHIAMPTIIHMKKMFAQHLDESTNVMIFEGRHFHYFKDQVHQEDTLNELIVPFAQEICKRWPLCKYNIIPNYFGWS